MTDARFEDGAEGPLRLRAEAAEDIPVLSTLLQDAVGQVGDLRWARRRRRFVALLNRLRWEDVPGAGRAGRRFERVRALLVADSVVGVKSAGLDPADPTTVVSLLAVAFEAGEDGAGTLVLTFAGDGELRIGVECLDLTLTDVTRPYQALARGVPDHGA